MICYLTSRVQCSVLALSLTALTFPACEKDNIQDCYEAREPCPIPTELPAETCNNAHAIGMMVDTILFVASYAPNNSGIGSEPPRGGLRARWETGAKVIRIEAQHSLRPDGEDTRFMFLTLFVNMDMSIESISFSYRNASLATAGFSTSGAGAATSNLSYNADSEVLCGTFSAILSVTTEAYGFTKSDTVQLTSGVIDTEVSGRA